MSLYNFYWRSFGAFIGIDVVLEEILVFPHAPLGVFINNSAHIGKQCVFNVKSISSTSIDFFLSKKKNYYNLSNI